MFAPFMSLIGLGIVLAALALGGIGGYRWAKSDVVKCELKAEKKEVAQQAANTTEVKRQTKATNKAAAALEKDRATLQTQFQEVRNEQTETALAQPDRANATCFDADWLRLDAAATRAANSRLAHESGALKALPAPTGADSGNGGGGASQPNAASRALRGLFGHPQTPGAVGEAARSPEKN